MSHLIIPIPVKVYVTWLDSTEWLDRTSFSRVSCTSFHFHSPLLTFFLCFIVLFQSCCFHAHMFRKTLVHEFPIFYSYTEWNLLSSGINTLVWWRACYQKTNYKQIKKSSSCRASADSWRNDLQWLLFMHSPLSFI